MGQPIQFRRGNKPNLPNLNNGEPAFVQDEKDLYVGTSNGNQLVGGKSVMDKFDDVNEKLAQNVQDLSSREINVLFPPPPLVPAYADNTNDDSPIINAIIDNLSSNGGGTVYIPNGRYYTASGVIIKENVYIKGDTNTVLDAKSNSALTQISTVTPTVADLTQTSDIFKGDKTIQINNTVQKGDFVELASTERFTAEWDEGIAIRESYTVGEIMKVESATPTSITFTEPVSFDFLLSTNRWVRTFTPNKNLGIRNIILTRDYKTTGSGNGINMQNVDDFSIENVRTENANGSGILITRSKSGVVKNIKGIGGYPDLGLDYLINIGSGSKSINVDTVHGSGFRHVTTAGGSYVTSIGNTFKNIFVENSQNQSIDLHANTLNYVYENVFCDKGVNISGIGHFLKNIQSKSGALYLYEGGKNITFDGIIMKDCTGFNSSRTAFDITFKNVEIYIKSLLGNISFGANSYGFKFDNVKIINSNIQNAANNTEADGLFSSSIYRALEIKNNYVLNNVLIEGFPIGVEITGNGAIINNITLKNCGWKTALTGQPNTVIKYGIGANNSRLTGANVSCDLSQLDISTSRVITLASGAGNANITIRDISDGEGQSQTYNYGIVGGTGYNIFMQNVRPTVTTPNTSFTATGKFIYNTIVTDN